MPETRRNNTETATRLGRWLLEMGPLAPALLGWLYFIVLSLGIGLALLALMLWNGVLLLLALACFRLYPYLVRVEADIDAAQAERG